ncbi:MAG: UbiX family flavin prenyltransferase [Syntrophobacteraceae bacterium]
MNPCDAPPSRRIVVGITGASGVVYGMETLKALKGLGYESHVVLSEGAIRNFAIETSYSVEDVRDASGRLYDERDLAAPIASGSFLTLGMVVIPCTMKTLSAITHSYGANLLTRAADVTLKERRTLVLVVRETPLHRGHLELMLAAAKLGAVILPPIPAFYHKPATIEDIVLQTVGKALDCFRIEHDIFRRWNGA